MFSRKATTLLVVPLLAIGLSFLPLQNLFADSPRDIGKIFQKAELERGKRDRKLRKLDQEIRSIDSTIQYHDLYRSNLSSQKEWLDQLNKDAENSLVNVGPVNDLIRAITDSWDKAFKEALPAVKAPSIKGIARFRMTTGQDFLGKKVKDIDSSKFLIEELKPDYSRKQKLILTRHLNSIDKLSKKEKEMLIESLRQWEATKIAQRDPEYLKHLLKYRTFLSAVQAQQAVDLNKKAIDREVDLSERYTDELDLRKSLGVVEQEVIRSEGR